MFALMSSVASFAQLYEVKGVETKLVIYDGPKYTVPDCTMYETIRKTSIKWFAYSFYNMNSIPVSVEAKLYEYGELVSTKTFNLKSNETYIWKHEYNSDFKLNDRDSDSLGFRWTEEKHKPGPGNYYVKYKAYRLL